MKLTRAMMMFGGPTHRLQSQMMSAARVLDIQMSVLYLPDIALLSFDNNATGTSHIKLIRQGSAMDLGKLNGAFALYWKVRVNRLLLLDLVTTFLIGYTRRAFGFSCVPSTRCSHEEKATVQPIATHFYWRNVFGRHIYCELQRRLC